MKSVKLNSYIRDSITKHVLEKTNYHNELKKLNDQRLTAEEVYSSLYSKKVQEQMYSLADGWLPETDSLSLNLGGMSCYLYFKDKEKKRVFYKHKGERIVFAADHKLTIKFRDIEDKINTVTRDFYSYKSKVEATLRSVTTTAKLLVVWPELAEIVPPEVFVYDEPSLPAVCVSDLNKQIIKKD